ncbi:enoyl-CoA hydratase-related protein [Streptomyces sp. NPDC006477]|uniref:enoyl-CoA hydratase-related protein n=1 Tax=Streptomyces sp. NPDC006477 TaxID=3364747 RepID=UPI00369BC518
MTLGIELPLAADIRVAVQYTRFAQYEIRRGIYPFGGATFRFPRRAGWGNAMHWILPGEKFDAAEAHRIGLALAADGPAAIARATEIATLIAEKSAPLGVRTVFTSAHLAHEYGESAAIERLRPDTARLFATTDGAEGIQPSSSAVRPSSPAADQPTPPHPTPPGDFFVISTKTPPLFDLSLEIAEAREWAHGFAETYVRPVAAEYDEREEMPWAVIEEAIKVGV